MRSSLIIVWFAILSGLFASAVAAVTMFSRPSGGTAYALLVYLTLIVGGVFAVRRKKAGWLALAIAFALQIPQIHSALVTYKLFAGSNLGIMWRESSITFMAKVGGSWAFSPDARVPYFYGISVVALVFAWLSLSEAFRKEPNQPAQPTPGS